MSPSGRAASHAAWLAAAAVLGAVVAAEPRAVAVPLAFGVAWLSWRWPGAVLSVLAVGVLAVRPSLDAFGERHFGLSALAINPSVIFGLGVLWAGLILGIRRARDNRPLWPDRSARQAHAWLFAAYAIGLVSATRLYGSVGAIVATREVLRVASIVVAFLVVVWWVAERPDRARSGWIWLLVGAVPSLVTAVWQLITGTGNLELDGVNRLQGTLSHPNSFGVYLVPFVLFLVGGIPSSRGARRLVHVAGALILSTFILFTYSRTALLVLAAALAVLPFLQGRLGWQALAKVGAVALVVATLGWWLAGDLIRERFANLSFGRGAWEAAITGESENSFTWRIINWGVLVQMGMDHSILGHGMGMTTILNPLINSVNGVPFNAHNDFVRFFFETGLLGLVAYLVYGVCLCRWAFNQARSPGVARASMAYGVVAALASLMFLSGGTTELSLNTAILYELYGMLALIASTRRDAIIRTLPQGARTSASGRPLS